MYVTFNYEEHATPPYYHIFSVSNEVDLVFAIECSETPEMTAAAQAIVDAINSAVDLSLKQRTKSA